MSELLAADLSCFGSDDVAVIGWEDSPPTFGVDPPGIQPQWLWLISGSALWDRPRGSGTDLACSQGNCPAFTFMHLAPGSGLTFNTNGRWVLVTGHRRDPLAETCVYVYPPDWGGGFRPPDEQARQQCREAFVMVSIKPTAPPPGA